MEYKDVHVVHVSVNMYKVKNNIMIKCKVKCFGAHISDMHICVCIDVPHL